MSEYLQQRLRDKIFGKPPAEKKVYSIPKKSAKKIISEKLEKEKRGCEESMLQLWYKARQRQLTGRCVRCGATYNHTNLAYAIAATAHVLPKRQAMFPSVALHPDNYIELGAGCGCHHWYDNQASWEQVAADKIWPIVLEKFKMIEPKILERSKIPEVLAQEIQPKF